jgi:hypothetical protein
MQHRLSWNGFTLPAYSWLWYKPFNKIFQGVSRLLLPLLLDENRFQDRTVLTPERMGLWESLWLVESVALQQTKYKRAAHLRVTRVMLPDKMGSFIPLK